MKSNLFRLIISSLLVIVSVIWWFPNYALTSHSIAPDALIQASGPSVYFYGRDLQRYTFPNEKTYFTWYDNFSQVESITDAQLAARVKEKAEKIAP